MQDISIRRQKLYNLHILFLRNFLIIIVYVYILDMPSPKATLINQDLWTKFNKLETEMIITKSGR